MRFEVKTVGRHLIAEFYGCDVDVLNDVAVVKSGMLAAARRVGATVMGECFHAFEPQGVSGTVVISESHLSIHTWPEYGYASIDIYTCGGLDPRLGFETVGEVLGAQKTRVQEILRGLPEDLEGHGMLLPENVQVITKMTDAEDLRPLSPL